MSFAVRFALRAVGFALLAGGALCAVTLLLFVGGAAIELAVLWATGFWSERFPLGLIILVALAFGIAKATEEQP